MKYFAYGSNLNQKDLVKWCKKNKQPEPKLSDPRTFCLEGYKIEFTRYSEGRKGGVADIIKSDGEFCWGIIFDVVQEDLNIIDLKEGVSQGAYRQITLPKGMITYEVVKKQDFVQPHNDYIDLIIEGAKNYSLPQSWIDKLESFKI